MIFVLSLFLFPTTNTRVFRKTAKDDVNFEFFGGSKTQLEPRQIERARHSNCLENNSHPNDSVMVRGPCRTGHIVGTAHSPFGEAHRRNNAHMGVHKQKHATAQADGNWRQEHNQTALFGFWTM